MKWFKRFSNGLTHDLGFVMAFAAFGYYVVLASMVAQKSLTDQMMEFSRGSPQFALYGFIMLGFPAFILFGLFYIFWSKSRLDSHEEVIVEELLEERETLRKLLK